MLSATSPICVALSWPFSVVGDSCPVDLMVAAISGIAGALIARLNTRYRRKSFGYGVATYWASSFLLLIVSSAPHIDEAIGRFPIRLLILLPITALTSGLGLLVGEIASVLVRKLRDRNENA